MRLSSLAYVAAMIMAANLLADPGSSVPDVSDDELRIGGIFNAALPGTEQKGRLKLSVNPHLGDFVERDHVRTPLGLRYGLTETWEAGAGVETFFAHGFGDKKTFERYGLSTGRLGTKWRVGDKPWSNWDTAVGLEYVFPLGNPPTDISDGLNHLMPYATFAHRLNSYRSVRLFWGVGAEFVSKSWNPENWTKNELGDDTLSATAGAVWDRGWLHYTFETTLATTRLISGAERDVLTLRPGFVWMVPKKYTFRAKGRWFVAFSLRTVIGPDGVDFGSNAKLRVNFDLRRWWRDVTDAPKSPSARPSP